MWNDFGYYSFITAKQRNAICTLQHKSGIGTPAKHFNLRTLEFA